MHPSLDGSFPNFYSLYLSDEVNLEKKIPQILLDIYVENLINHLYV
jgi:hypothetical protein